jgi:hypothetical protein
VLNNIFTSIIKYVFQFYKLRPDIVVGLKRKLKLEIIPQINLTVRFNNDATQAS